MTTLSPRVDSRVADSFATNNRLTWDQSLPRYSIVIPARNEEETLGEVLEDVRHFTDDLILIDGHSLDDTVVIARQYDARVIQDRRSRQRGRRSCRPRQCPVSNHSFHRCGRLSRA